MGNTQASRSQPQPFAFWLLRRAALSCLTLSLSYAALAHTTTARAFSQTTSAPTAETPGTIPTDELIRPTLKPGSRGAEVTELQATLKLLGYYGGTVDGVYGQSTVSAVAQFQQAAGLNADGITGPATWNRLFPATAEIPAASTPSIASGATPMPTSNSPVSPSAGDGSASFPVPPGASPPPSSTPATSPTTSPRPTVKPSPSKVTPTTAKPATATRPAPESSPAAANPSSTAAVTLPVLRQGMKGSAVQSLQERLRSLGVFKGAVDGVFGAETLTAVKAAQRRFKLEPDGVVGAGTWSALLH